jgi:uncharacterized protein
MRNLLIDAGPLIALFNKRDSYHAKIIDFLKDNDVTYWTTWPVITEACHMLDFSVRAQLNLLEWIRRGGLHLVDLSEENIQTIINYTEKFSDVPMDLADASLMVASELISTEEIVSIDADFYIYRNIRNKYLRNVFLEKEK